MKKLFNLSVYFLLISISSVIASEEITTNYSTNNYGKSYIFTEQSVEFSVYPDGQFDFTYLGNYNGSNTSLTISSPNVNISYNAGYNYDMYVQYDNYGAVIQVEDIPIYYDEFGRIVQAGSVEIRYNNRRIVQVGGMFIYYNNYGNYSYYTGFINPFNYYYIYQPWHIYYAPPIYGNCIVYNYSYRNFYNPIRYSYNVHSNYYSNRGRNNISYNNGRRNFNKPGSQIHYKNGRTAVNSEFKSNRGGNSIAKNSRGNTTSSTNRNHKTTARNNSDFKSNDSFKRTNTRKVAYKRSERTTKPAQKSNYRKSTKTLSRNNTVKTSNRKTTYKNTNRKVATTNKTKSSSSNRKSNTSNRNNSQKRSRGL